MTIWLVSLYARTFVPRHAGHSPAANACLAPAPAPAPAPHMYHTDASALYMDPHTTQLSVAAEGHEHLNTDVCLKLLGGIIWDAFAKPDITACFIPPPRFPRSHTTTNARS
jgi:hypothetical protein